MKIGFGFLRAISRGTAGLAAKGIMTILLLQLTWPAPAGWFDHAKTAAPLEGARIAVSLRALQERGTSNGVDDSISMLGGLNWVEGYVLDHDSNDIVIFGRAVATRPHLYGDDVSVLLKSAQAGIRVYCSLDPDSKNVLAYKQWDPWRHMTLDKRIVQKQAEDVFGPQRVTVGGIPKDSRVAHVMIDADYLMKGLSMGRPIIKGTYSYSYVLSTTYGSQASSMSRFWFKVWPQQILFSEELTNSGSSLEVTLNDLPVSLATERQVIASNGELSDATENSFAAMKWAGLFTKRFSILSSSNPSFADLEDVYRLKAILDRVVYTHANQSVGLDLRALASNYRLRHSTSMPPSYPAIASYCGGNPSACAAAGIFTLNFVCGGVDLSTQPSVNAVTNVLPEAVAQNAQTYPLFALRTRIIESRPAKSSVYWMVQ